MGTARAKEQTTAPAEFDGMEDHKRKNFRGKGKRPGGSSGKKGMKRHKRGSKRY